MNDLNTIKNHALKLRDFLLDLLFPVECVHCNQEGEFLCRSCRKKIFLKHFQACPHCRQATDFGRFCRNCRNDALNGVLVISEYRDKVMEKCINRFKYNLIKSLAEPLSILMASHFRTTGFRDGRIFGCYSPADILVVPVPLHKKRLNWRGFNQSEELARRLASDLGFAFCADSLVKTKNTRPQAKLKAWARKENLKDCFAWTGGPMAQKRFILVDDVTTTCSTLAECARTLKKAGAKTVHGLVLADG